MANFIKEAASSGNVKSQATLLTENASLKHLIDRQRRNEENMAHATLNVEDLASGPLSKAQTFKVNDSREEVVSAGKDPNSR